MGGYSIFVVMLGIISLVSGYSQYRDRIPNGHKVPSPCNTSVTWNGVGHLNINGGGARNPFGLAFAANNVTWNATICQMDSDGDGRTNGEELGDPNCVWTSGPAARNTGLSHPGFCDPINSQACSGTTMQCPTSFDCPAIKAAGTFSVDVNIPETAVPAKETTYICMNFELPHDQPYHIIATTPRIDNINVMHHIVAYECDVDSAAELKDGVNKTYECSMSPDENCQRIISIWSSGVQGNCFDENAGFLVGGNNGFKYAAFQIHWNNPDEINTYTDSSGLTFHMTSNLRPNNAGVMMIEQNDLTIPGGEEFVVQTATCAGRCTEKIMTNKIYVTSVFNHMHLLGSAQITELHRDGQLIADLGTDEVYDYNSPSFHDQDTPIEVRPGDEIKTTCVYSSEGRTRTTYFGLSTSDEMCIAFLMYYPKENLDEPTCSQVGDISVCDFEDGMVNGCNFNQLNNIADPIMTAHYIKVFDICRIEMCTKECLNYLRVKRAEPCFTGSVYRMTRKSIADAEMDAGDRMNSFKYFLLMDSCDLALAAEKAENQTDTAASIAPMVPVFVLTMTALLLS